MEVVGIIGDGRYASLQEAPKGFGYLPFAPQFGTSNGLAGGFGGQAANRRVTLQVQFGF